MYFCIRDDDTSFFTKPEHLDMTYSKIWKHGAVSLAVIPFHKGCQTKSIPEAYWGTNDVYPLEYNHELIQYLRSRVREGRVEIMLHGYHHEDFADGPEFIAGPKLTEKVAHGKQYLEHLLDTKVRVFVPPHNSISRTGLKAVTAAGLHLGTFSGLRSAWPLTSWQSWWNWWLIKYWMQKKGYPYPGVLKLGEHRELIAHAVTPISDIEELQNHISRVAQFNGVFCLATHYWEFDHPHNLPTGISVRQQVSVLVETILAMPNIKWTTLGNILCKGE